MIVVLLLLLIVIVKFILVFVGYNFLFGFLGIFYLIFWVVGMIIEICDGVVKEFKWWEFICFMFFMLILILGLIDCYWCFVKDYKKVLSCEKYFEMLGKVVKYLFIGFLYKFVIDYFFVE